MSAFQYSLNSSTIKTTPLMKKIQVAAEAGYAGIEIWHDDLDAYLESGGRLADVHSALQSAGLQVPTTIHMKDWFQPAGEEHDQAMQIAERKLAQAAEIGAKFTVAGPPHGPADRDLGRRHYHELLQLGQQYGVRPAFEYLGFAEDICTVDAAIDIVVGSAHPNACVVLDPFHCWVGGGGHESIRQLMPDQIAVSHFNDAPASPPPHTQRDPDRVMPGDGAVDLSGYLQTLYATGYRGFLSLELFRNDLWQQDPLAVAKEGLARMTRVVEAAFADTAE